MKKGFGRDKALIIFLPIFSTFNFFCYYRKIAKNLCRPFKILEISPYIITVFEIATQKKKKIIRKKMKKKSA